MKLEKKWQDQNKEIAENKLTINKKGLNDAQPIDLEQLNQVRQLTMNSALDKQKIIEYNENYRLYTENI